MSFRGSKKRSFNRGVLESAGLAEVSHFLRKALQQVSYAKFALEQTDFSESIRVLESVGAKGDSLNNLLVEMEGDLHLAGRKIAEEVDARDLAEERGARDLAEKEKKSKKPRVIQKRRQDEFQEKGITGRS